MGSRELGEGEAVEGVVALGGGGTLARGGALVGDGPAADAEAVPVAVRQGEAQQVVDDVRLVAVELLGELGDGGLGLAVDAEGLDLVGLAPSLLAGGCVGMLGRAATLGLGGGEGRGGRVEQGGGHFVCPSV